MSSCRAHLFTHCKSRYLCPVHLRMDFHLVNGFHLKLKPKWISSNQTATENERKGRKPSIYCERVKSDLFICMYIFLVCAVSFVSFSRSNQANSRTFFVDFRRIFGLCDLQTTYIWMPDFSFSVRLGSQSTWNITTANTLKCKFVHVYLMHEYFIEIITKFVIVCMCLCTWLSVFRWNFVTKSWSSGFKKKAVQFFLANFTIV